MGSVSPFKYMSQKNGNGYIVGRTSPPSAVSSSPTITITNNSNSNRQSPGGGMASASCFASPAGVSNSPPNLHFAGSKYFDAPAPDSLPRPPMHWTARGDLMAKTMSVSSSKRRLFNNVDGGQSATTSSVPATGKQTAQPKASHKMGMMILAGGCASAAGSDIFSHNLKLMLNVQA